MGRVDRPSRERAAGLLGADQLRQPGGRVVDLWVVDGDLGGRPVDVEEVVVVGATQRLDEFICLDSL